jgi:hypothetical protein
MIQNICQVGLSAARVLLSSVARPADSRLFAGVHFRTANDDGAKLGQLVAGRVFDRIQPAKGAKAAVASEKGAAGGRRMRA